MNTPRTPSLDDLEPEARAAIIAFRNEHGDLWRQKLAWLWHEGKDDTQPGGHHLRRIRNTFGPAWLAKIRE